QEIDEAGGGEFMLGDLDRLPCGCMGTLWTRSMFLLCSRSQFLGHHIAVEPGRVAGQRGGGLEALFQVEPLRLDFERVEGDARAPTAAGLRLGHRNEAAAEPVAAQILGEEDPLDGKLAEIAAAVDAAEDFSALGV